VSAKVVTTIRSLWLSPAKYVDSA